MLKTHVSVVVNTLVTSCHSGMHIVGHHRGHVFAGARRHRACVTRERKLR